MLDKLEPLAGNSGFCGDTVSLSIISEKITSPKYSARLRLKILISYPQNMSSLAILAARNRVTFNWIRKDCF